MVVTVLDPDTGTVLQPAVPLCRYCKSYLVIGRSLEGLVQDTLRAGLPDTITLVTDGVTTSDGTVQQDDKVQR